MAVASSALCFLHFHAGFLFILSCIESFFSRYKNHYLFNFFAKLPTKKLICSKYSHFLKKYNLIKV